MKFEWGTLTPESAAATIVAELLSDLPADRQETVRKAIEEAMGEWGDLVGATTLEGGER